jgi:DNA-binding CsgD family transcriptional regulator
MSDTMECAMPPNPVHVLSEAKVRPAVNDVIDGHGSAPLPAFHPAATGRFLSSPDRPAFTENSGPMLVAWNLPERTRARLLAALRVAELDAPILWIMNDRAGAAPAGAGSVEGPPLPPRSADTDHGGRVDAGPGPAPSRVRGWDLLSERERGIAYLIGEALTNRQIAQRVFLSPHTVNYYLRRIFKKLGINSRVELAGLTRSLLAG